MYILKLACVLLTPMCLYYPVSAFTICPIILLRFLVFYYSLQQASLEALFFKCLGFYLRQLKRRLLFIARVINVSQRLVSKLGGHYSLYMCRLFSSRSVASVKQIVACIAFKFSCQSGLSNSDFPPLKNERFPLLVLVYWCIFIRCSSYFVH